MYHLTIDLFISSDLKCLIISFLSVLLTAGIASVDELNRFSKKLLQIEQAVGVFVTVKYIICRPKTETMLWHIKGITYCTI